jgi:hypothetical protein
VSQGTLIPSGGQTAQGQDQSIFQRQEQQTITTTDQQRTNSQRQMISQPQPTRTGGASSVRGYW